MKGFIIIFLLLYFKTPVIQLEAIGIVVVYVLLNLIHSLSFHSLPQQGMTEPCVSPAVCAWSVGNLQMSPGECRLFTLATAHCNGSPVSFSF